MSIIKQRIFHFPPLPLTFNQDLKNALLPLLQLCPCSSPPPPDEKRAAVVRMQTIKTVETHVPFLKESFFTTTFKGRRKSSVTNILRRQQHSLLLQQQQQPCVSEPSHQHPKPPLPPSVEKGQGQRTPEHQRLARSSSSPLCKTAERPAASADGEREAGQQGRKDERAREAAQGRGAERGASSSEPVAVGASLLLLSSTALAQATSSSQLPATAASNQQGSGKALSGGGAASVAGQEEDQPARPRPQQHGLIAKGVRLLKNMGNQEAKQKKGGGSGGAAGEIPCDGDADVREVEKKSKKSHKPSKGGGENGSKKKSKSESKSVFSNMKIKRGLSKAKGSKDDIVEEGRKSKAALRPNAEASLSPGEAVVVSDVEGDLSRLTGYGQQSVTDEFGRRANSGSDLDLYSFHSAAAENEDLLFDIQRAIGEQRVPAEEVLEVLTGASLEGTKSEWNEDPGKSISHQPLSKDVLSSPSALCGKLENERRVISLSRNSSVPGSLSESGPSSSAPDTARSSGSLFPKTNSSYSFPDTTGTTASYESAEGPQDDLDCAFLPPRQSRGQGAPQSDLPVAGPSHKSFSSMDLSTEREEEYEHGRRDFLSLKRRKSSFSNSMLPSDSPPVSHSRRTSSSTVKFYPPVLPSYVKTTTRQLSSPVSSPITSPNVPRRTDAAVFSGCIVGASGAKGLTSRKQRSCSIAGPFSASEDWSKDLSELQARQGGGYKVQEQQASEKGYWTLGSRRAHHAPQTSSATSYLDVFSGESQLKLKLNHAMILQTQTSLVIARMWR